MMRRAMLAIILAFAAVSTLAAEQADQEPGGFGFALEVDGEGFFLNPTLKSVTIKSVVAGRPASNAGIKVGDQIVEVEGKPVVGAKARDLEPLLKKHVGETLALRLRRPNAELYSVSLVAAAKQN